MPLDTEDERLIGEFHRFNDPIASASANHQSLPWDIHSLVVQAIDAHALPTENVGESSARNGINTVSCLGRAGVFVRLWHLRWNVLIQRPPKGNIQHLCS